MPLAFDRARAIDVYAAAIAASAIGRSRRLDQGVALLARHLAKIHIGLLVLLLVGGRGAEGRRRRETALRMAVALPVTIGAVSLVGKLVERDRPFTKRPDGSTLVD